MDAAGASALIQLLEISQKVLYDLKNMGIIRSVLQSWEKISEKRLPIQRESQIPAVTQADL